MNCSTCSASIETKKDRLPKGWKRHAGVFCTKCWKERYVLRAVTIPVVRPLGEGVGWPELREALRESWAHTTAAMNWMTTQLYVRDTHRTPNAEKLVTKPRTYLYPETRQRFPELPSSVCATLEQSTTAKYSKRRYEVLWTCDASLQNYRYPQPAICPAAAWKPLFAPAGKDGGDLVPAVDVPLLHGQRFLLQLRGGREFRRQLADFRLLVDGTAIKCEMAILRQRTNGGDHRNGSSARDSGGQKFATRIMLKLVGWFPRKPAEERSGTLFLKTAADCFLEALDEKGQKLRTWNYDHVRRWISEHNRRLHRWSDDQKAENRPVASFQSRREAAVHKFRNRIQSSIKEAAAQVAGVAKRMRYATVRYDSSCRDYFGTRFDWSGFSSYLAQRLNQDGIALELASGEVVSSPSDVAREDETE